MAQDLPDGAYALDSKGVLVLKVSGRYCFHEGLRDWDRILNIPSAQFGKYGGSDYFTPLIDNQITITTNSEAKNL